MIRLIVLSDHRFTDLLWGIGFISLAALNASAQPTETIGGTWQRYFAPPDAPGAPPAQPDPPLRPEYVAAWQARQEEIRLANERGEPFVTASTFCLPTGMPSMMGGVGTFPMEILLSEAQVTIIQEAYTQVRRIYLDRPQLMLDEIEPGYYGRSVGYWDGNALAIDTVGILEHVRYREVPHTPQLRIAERIRVVEPDILWVEITMTDPEVLERPWEFTFAFRRLENYEMIEYICEDNREYADDNGATRLRIDR